MGVKYDIVVQNWTRVIKGYGNLSYPSLPSDYAGEVIPPYAVMLVVSPVRYYKGTAIFPVGLPDDDSELWQQAGQHLFNGPTPIPLATFGSQPPTNTLPANDGYGRATQNFPAPVLTDLGDLEPSPTPYDPWDGLGVPFRIKSGKWALGLTDIDTQFAPYVGVSPFGLSDASVPGGVQYTYKAFWVSAYARQVAEGF